MSIPNTRPLFLVPPSKCCATVEETEPLSDEDFLGLACFRGSNDNYTDYVDQFDVGVQTEAMDVDDIALANYTLPPDSTMNDIMSRFSMDAGYGSVSCGRHFPNVSGQDSVAPASQRLFPITPEPYPQLRYDSPTGSFGGDQSVLETEATQSDGTFSPSSTTIKSPTYPSHLGLYAYNVCHVPSGADFDQGPLSQWDLNVHGQEREQEISSVQPRLLLQHPDDYIDVDGGGLENVAFSFADPFDDTVGVYQKREDTDLSLASIKSVESDDDADDLDNVSSRAGRMSVTEPRPTYANPFRKTATANDRNVHGRKVRQLQRKPVSGTRQCGRAKQQRGFFCTFQRYGCDSSFASKNEWKRHVLSQHLRVGYWCCDLGSCSSNVKAHGDTNTKEPKLFNRKDLFTQHLRRMHGLKPHGVSTYDAKHKECAAFEASLVEIRKRCWHKERDLPQQCVCTVCGKEFRSTRAWDERMEHIGGHVAQGEVEMNEDVGIRDWMEKEGLLKKVRGTNIWRLVDWKGAKTKREAVLKLEDIPFERGGVEGYDGRVHGKYDY